MSNVYQISCRFDHSSYESYVFAEPSEENQTTRFECNMNFSVRYLESIRDSRDFSRFISETFRTLASRMEYADVDPPYYVYCSPVIMEMILSRNYLDTVDSFHSSNYISRSCFIFGYEVVSDYDCHDPAHFEESIIITNVKKRSSKKTGIKIQEERFPIIYKFYQ